MKLEVIWKDRAFRAALRSAPAEMAAGVRQAFAGYLRRFATRVSTQRLRGRPGLARRTGSLARSAAVTVTGTTISTLEGRYSIGGQAVPYARIHEFGGTILPKRGKFLAIPLGPVLTAAGVARGGPRQYPGLRLNGRLLVDADGKAFFLLVRSVRIPARLGVRELWARDAGSRLDSIRAGVQRAMDRIAAKGRD